MLAAPSSSSISDVVLSSVDRIPARLQKSSPKSQRTPFFEKLLYLPVCGMGGGGGANACLDGLGHLYEKPSFWQKKVPQGVHLTEGGGGQKLFVQCLKRQSAFQKGNSLRKGA